MNAENLRSIANDLRTHESQFDLDRWRGFRNPHNSNYEVDNPYLSCNTVCCICGWVNARMRNYYRGDVLHYSDVDSASAWLGLSYDFAYDLFIPEHHPKMIDYDSPWRQAARLGIIPGDMDIYEVNADQAADVLEAIADGRITTY